MQKYRASILLLVIAFVFIGMHFYIGWQDFVLEAEEAGSKAYVSDWFYRFAKEEAEGFPAEMTALAIELALFAGFLRMFKPYDEDTEKIKNLEKALHERLDKIEESVT